MVLLKVAPLIEIVLRLNLRIAILDKKNKNKIKNEVTFEKEIDFLSKAILWELATKASFENL